MPDGKAARSIEHARQDFLSVTDRLHTAPPEQIPVLRASLAFLRLRIQYYWAHRHRLHLPPSVFEGLTHLGQ